MNRVAVLAPILTAAFALATTVTTATSAAAPPTATPSASLRPAAFTLLQVADSFGLEAMRRDVIDPLIRWQRDVRDVMHGATDRLASVFNFLGDHTGVTIPDLTVLQVDPIDNSSSSGFGWREDPFNKRGKFHSGADFRGKHGTPVVAAGAGVVTFCGDQNGYGNVVYVDHGGGVVTRYAHLRRIETARHATVAAGQRIGQVGSTGRSTGPHLHFEIRLDGLPVDPVTAMAVAELERESPTAGRIAAFALAPELQSRKRSDVDPPKGKQLKTRPERPGRTKRDRPLS